MEITRSSFSLADVMVSSLNWAKIDEKEKLTISKKRCFFIVYTVLLSVSVSKSVGNILNYLFLFKMGSSKNEIPPEIIINTVCEVHTSQPKAVPTVEGMWYNKNICAINSGNAPKPLFVNPMARLPMTNAVMTAPKLIVLVSSRAKMAR